MKNIIIWGAPRSGKGTLSSMVVEKFGHSWIPIDAVREYTKVILADNPMPKDNFERTKIMTPAIIKLVEILRYTTKQYGKFFLLDGCNFDMNQIVGKINKDEWVIIGMGYSDMTVDEKLGQMIKYETENDWTWNLDVPTKERLCAHYIQESKVVKETAEHLGIKFFDASDMTAALDGAIEYLETIL